MSQAGANGATAAAAAHQQRIRNAVRACGSIVEIAPEGFEQIVSRMAAQGEHPLVVHAEGGWFSTSYTYLTNYKGLFFYTKSPVELWLPAGAEIILVKKIWIPS